MRAAPAAALGTGAARSWTQPGDTAFATGGVALKYKLMGQAKRSNMMR